MSAQSSSLDRTRTTRSLTGDVAVRMAAEDAAERAGLSCAVGAAVLRNRDDYTSARHFEVSCRSGEGYLITSDASGDVAHDCLLLQASATALERQDPTASRRAVVCELPANTNPIRRYAELARSAGLSCRVNEGRLIGRTPDHATVYEIGCLGSVGAWIEVGDRSIAMTDCISVHAHGKTCDLTDDRERAAALSRWFEAGDGLECEPLSVRAMGRTAAGPAYFQVDCRHRSPVVVGRDQAGHTVETMTCEQAAERLEPCRPT